MSTIIETKLLISGQDGGAQKSVEALAKALRDVGEAAKVSAPVEKLAKSLLQVEKAEKAVTAAMKAQAGSKDAETRLKATTDAAKTLATEFDRARKAAEAFKGVKIEKGSDQARAAKDAAQAVREAGKAYRQAEGEVRRATTAVAAQSAAFQTAARTATALGAPIDRLADHQRKLAGSINTTTQALLRQEAAEKRAAATAQQTAARRAGRRDAAGTIAAGVSVYAATKGKKIASEAVQSAADFDLAVRKQKVFTDISPDDQKRLLAQAKQIGQETQFSNIDVVKAQTAAMQGLPAGYSSSTKAQVAEGIVGHVRNYSTLMETDLKQGAETIRGFLQQTGKDISTGPKALYEANKATNQLVKMAKLGGMDGEDVAQFAKYAASSATAAGISTDTTLTLGALARRGGLRGDEAGTFIRAASGKLVSPDNPGHTALAAAGLTHSNYVTMPDRLSTAGLEGEFQRKMGKSFSPAIRKKLDAINSDKDLIADRGRYSTAVTGAVESMLGKTKKGTVSALKSGKAARIAGGFHKVSGKSVDTERLLQDIFQSKMTLPQLNAFFTGKHGGKGAITQGQWDEFKANRSEISKAGDDPNFAKNKADYVFAGVGGSFENLKGSLENFVLQVGLANEGLIKFTADGIGKGVDAFSNLSQTSQQLVSLVGGVAVAGGGIAAAGKLGGKLLGVGGGAVALNGSAAALTASATALDAAALKLAGGKLTDVPDKPGKGGKKGGGIGGAIGKVAGALSVYGLADVAQDYGVLQPPDVSRGWGRGALEALDPGLADRVFGKTDPTRAVPSMTRPPGAMPLTVGGGGLTAFGLNGPSEAIRAQEGGADSTKKVGEESSTATPLLNFLKNSVTILGSSAEVATVQLQSLRGGIGALSGDGTSGGGGGGLIHKASFGGGDVGGAAPAGRGGSGGGGGGVRGNENAEVVAYIRASAARNGIDPDTAVRVSRTEGLGGFQPGKRDTIGDGGQSNGPWQLYHGGGLGNAFQRETGLSAKDTTTWKAQTDFAMRKAREGGWTPWHGARNNGIGRWQGIGGQPDERSEIMQKKTSGSGRGDLNAAADRMHQAAERFESLQLASHHTIEVSAAPGTKARTTGMRSSASGPMQANTGVSMPQAQARDSDWI